MTTILIVDDSDIVRMELKALLETDQYVVLEAVDGNDGLKKAQDNKVDVIITDLNMPELDGISMVERLRKNPNYAKTPVFMLTTENSAELKMAGKTVGIIGWIVKPVKDEKFLSFIRKASQLG